MNLTNIKNSITIFVISVVLPLILFSCEGSRSRRMLNTVDSAIDDYNNGDSSTLIGLIVFGLIIGILWVIKKVKEDD